MDLESEVQLWSEQDFDQFNIEYLTAVLKYFPKSCSSCLGPPLTPFKSRTIVCTSSHPVP